jgi:general nucleoside transport system permease protein
MEIVNADENPAIPPAEITLLPVTLPDQTVLPKWASEIGAFVLSILMAMIVFAAILLLLGKNPLEVYSSMLKGTLGSSYALSEIVVKMIPFILCALAVAIPAQLGLITVGGEGQIYIGAIFAGFVALTLGESVSTPVLIPLLVIAGMLGGALWGGLCGVLRAYLNLNETISSLLLTYIASLTMDFLVSGPLKDRSPMAQGQAYSPNFPDNAMLPTFFNTRISLGIVFALAGILFYFWLLTYTRWGYKMRVVGGNPEAAVRSGIKIGRYIVIAMMLGGAFAGLSGMVEVIAIQGRLRGGISNGYGYVGFLVAWLAGQRPWLIVFMAALLGLISFGGDSLQFGSNLPASTVNILMAFILFFVLRNQGLRAKPEKS